MSKYMLLLSHVDTLINALNPSPQVTRGTIYRVAHKSVGKIANSTFIVEAVSYTHLDVYKRQTPVSK